MLKSCFQNIDPKLLDYRDFKSFSPQAFEEDVREELIDRGNSYDKLPQSWINMLLKKENGLGVNINTI